MPSTLDLLRVAAEERLCVDLEYNGERRVVEPYGLRVTGKGHVLLSARRADTDKLRTYRVDRITRVQITPIKFSPLFSAEMTAGGPLLPASVPESSEKHPAGSLQQGA